jgi:carbamoyltransferase
MSRDLPRAVLGIYGISDRGSYPTPRWTHDHGLALVVDGRVEWALELERVTRVKHDNRLPLWIERLVDDRVVQLPDEFVIASVDSLVGRCFVSATGRWRFEADQAPLGGPALQPARASIATCEFPAFAVAHEAAHVGAALPFYPDWDDRTLLVHVDGGASQSNASAWRWRHGRLQHVHDDWATLWAVLNFGHNDLTHTLLGLDKDRRMAAPGRLMGLAPHGESTDEMCRWMERNDWFREHWRNPGAFSEAAKRDWRWTGDLTNLKDPFVLSIAASVQAHFEDVVTGWIETRLQSSGCDRLVLSGGAALNISNNTRLTKRLSAGQLHVPPCCNDSGLAIGAAALTWRTLFGPVDDGHGPFLQSVGLGPAPSGGVAPDPRYLADCIAAGDVLGWSKGAAEVGPRALGHRSLLCSPASLESRRRVSEEIKRREWYRPVAPVILRELADDVFPGSGSSPLSRFMLEAFPVSNVWRDRVPAASHIDGTARAQVVDPSDGLSELGALLEACWERHGLPCLVNTSFNGPGEPIVHSKVDALECGRRLGIDGVVIDDRFFRLRPTIAGRPGQ